MNTVDALRPVLELIYFAAGPVIAVLAAIGLWHIKVTKDSTRIAARRQALALAAEQCERYQRTIVPLQNTLDNAIAGKGITFLARAEVTVEANRVRVKFNNPNEFYDQMMEIATEMLPVVNSMEAFAVYFMSGAADEKVAYSCVGASFCYYTKKVLAQIAPFHDTGHFHNLLRLFLLWNARSECEKLLRERQLVEEKLRSVDNTFIAPVGTI
jgi:hypothetical protein